jgi:Na+-driven multidrug efflux pump
MVHIWAGVFTALGVANGKWIINENLVINGMIRTTIGAIINVVLNYILIPVKGIDGAAWATLISYFVANYFGLFFYSKTKICFWQQTRAFNIIRYKR